MSPCSTCKKVPDPEKCKASNGCEEWKAWFRETWNDIRRQFIPGLQKTYRKSWKGCDNDCENCKYEDCMKPDVQL